MKLSGQHENGGQSSTEADSTEIAHNMKGEEHEHPFDPGQTAFHHISDQNVYNIGPFNFPLPCILYTKGKGWEMFSSSKFGFDAVGHGAGHKAYHQFVLHEGLVHRIQDPSFPQGEVEVSGFLNKEEVMKDKKVEVSYVSVNGKEYKLDKKSTADGGLFGGGITSFYDFSIGKNALSMLIVCLLLGWMFLNIARAYKNNPGRAPKGIQNLIEPIILFIRDEVAKPFIGAKYEKFFPFLLALFFFILGLNLFGQIPFFGGSNVTGSLSVTMVLALIAFVLTTINGNKNYWKHVLWMPGVPAWVKTILTPVEILGVFIKPLTLMLRLFANITAGHMTLVIFVGLIFVFGKSGQNVGASIGTSIGSGLLSMFMMAIELLVAFIQAYVFTLLTASYLGAATEEHHHAEEHH
ncbi:MAG: F0F1 ATP synthase subunit A [Saprospiraceae bacterium]